MSRRANAVSSLHGQVSRAMWTPLYPRRSRGPRADRPHHQRHPRPHLARAADAPAVRPASRPRLAAALRRAGLLGSDRRRRRRRAVGDASDAQGAADRHRAAAGGAVRRAAAASRRNSIAQLRRCAEPGRADHRLRAAVRHLQARQPDPAGHRGDRLARQRSADADSVGVRRQGAPARLAGQGRSCSRSRG